jgi:hypothetical protein
VVDIANRRGDRAVEGARLEIVCTPNKGTGGSNPPLSAIPTTCICSNSVSSASLGFGGGFGLAAFTGCFAESVAPADPLAITALNHRQRGTTILGNPFRRFAMHEHHRYKSVARGVKIPMADV